MKQLSSWIAGGLAMFFVCLFSSQDAMAQKTFGQLNHESIASGNGPLSPSPYGPRTLGELSNTGALYSGHHGQRGRGNYYQPPAYYRGRSNYRGLNYGRGLPYIPARTNWGGVSLNRGGIGLSTRNFSVFIRR